MPTTIGLFGSWGSGKTTALAFAADTLQQSEDHVLIYFNAWKYSGFTEVIPALIYKVLSTVRSVSPHSKFESIGRIMLGLGRKYAESVGSWSKAAVGIDFVEVAKDAYDVAKIIRDSTDPIDRIAQE